MLSSDASWLDIEESADDSPSQVVVAVPETIAARDARLVSVWPALSAKQRTVLQALQHNYFNVRKTLQSLAATSDAVDKKTYWRWKTNNQNFAYALLVLKTQARESLDPERMLLRTAEIAEDALEPKDVYFKGAPTGEKRADYTAALKATEMQMKHKKLLGNDEEEKKGFGGRNITLAVQVVLAGGEVKDITRKGITIDAPVIEVLP